VNTLGPRLLVDVLTEWGLHEAEGRARNILPKESMPPDEEPDRSRLGLEAALRTRAPVIGRILMATPHSVLEVEILPDEAEEIYLFDGTSLSQWAAAKIVEDSPSGEYVRDLARSDQEIAGRLVATLQMPGQEQRGPAVLYDGWHRAAAWLSQMQRGRRYPVRANLIITRDPDPFLSLLFAAGPEGRK
jgi:hypothetical protein